MKLFDKTRTTMMFLDSPMMFSISFRRFPRGPSSGPIFLYHSIIMVAFLLICKQFELVNISELGKIAWHWLDFIYIYIYIFFFFSTFQFSFIAKELDSEIVS